MERVRKVIDQVLCNDDRNVLTDWEWEQIKAAIIAARPGMDEICAALRELAQATHHSHNGTALRLWGDGSGAVLTYGETRKSWTHCDDIPAAIRSLIPEPEPEPTPEENARTVRLALKYVGTADRVPRACEALERLLIQASE
jgi:hypothetical protein